MFRTVTADRRSSRLLRQEFPWLQSRLPHGPTAAFVSTVGGTPRVVIKRYIENVCRWVQLELGQPCRRVPAPDERYRRTCAEHPTERREQGLEPCKGSAGSVYCQPG